MTTTKHLAITTIIMILITIGVEGLTVQIIAKQDEARYSIHLELNGGRVTQISPADPTSAYTYPRELEFAEKLQKSDKIINKDFNPALVEEIARFTINNAPITIDQNENVGYTHTNAQGKIETDYGPEIYDQINVAASETEMDRNLLPERLQQLSTVKSILVDNVQYYVQGPDAYTALGEKVGTYTNGKLDVSDANRKKASDADTESNKLLLTKQQTEEEQAKAVKKESDKRDRLGAVSEQLAQISLWEPGQENTRVNALLQEKNNELGVEIKNLNQKAMTSQGLTDEERHQLSVAVDKRNELTTNEGQKNFIEDKITALEQEKQTITKELENPSTTSSQISKIELANIREVFATALPVTPPPTATAPAKPSEFSLLRYIFVEGDKKTADANLKKISADRTVINTNLEKANQQVVTTSSELQEQQNKINELRKSDPELKNDQKAAIDSQTTLTNQLKTEQDKFTAMSTSTNWAATFWNALWGVKPAESPSDETKKAQQDKVDKLTVDLAAQKDKVDTLTGFSKLSFDARTAKATILETILLTLQTALDDAQKKLGEQQDKLAENNAARQREQFRQESLIQNSVTVMRAFIKSYSEFSGIGRFGSLFLTGKDFETWRNNVNEVLCTSIILGGKACWVSKICNDYIPTTVGGNSLIALTPGGPKGAVHLEVEKSLPIDFVEKDATQAHKGFLYKITYSITNTNDKTMTYNLKFNGEKTIVAFEPSKELIAGATDGKTGSATIYKESLNDYTSACLFWSPGITSWSGKYVGQFCTPISQYLGAATTPYTAQTTAPGTCTDGIQNQGESATDCGGPCPTCGTPQKPKEFGGF